MTPKITTVADLIKELEAHCGDPSTTQLSIALGAHPVTITSMMGYPDHLVILLKPEENGR